MKRFLVLVLGLLLFAAPALAGDLVWERFMRNNFDVLAIGEITGLSDTVCTIRVDSTIVSARGDRAQLRPDAIELRLDAEGRDHATVAYVGNMGAERQIGDYVICAAYQMDNGQFDGDLYKLDSLDVASLRIEVADKASAAFRCEVAMMEDFIHSDGRHVEFDRVNSKDGKNWEVWRYSDQKHRRGEMIFSVEIPG